MRDMQLHVYMEPYTVPYMCCW